MFGRNGILGVSVLRAAVPEKSPGKDLWPCTGMEKEKNAPEIERKPKYAMKRNVLS